MAAEEIDAKDGVLVVDKPSGPTSHDVVARVRRGLKVKVGHTGTLDPLATGVLPLVLGQATRLARFFQDTDKEYLCLIRLGRCTDTYDCQGRTVEEKPVPPLDEPQVHEALARFVGIIEQRPPLYSAIRVKGRRLYEYARRGQSAEVPSRRVTIHSIRLLDLSRESLRVVVECSSGTYIRSLAHDLGKGLGCGAHVEELRRTRSGAFSLDRAVPLEEAVEGWRSAFLSLEQLLPEMPRVDLDDSSGKRVGHGNAVDLGNPGLQGICRLFSGGKLLAIAQVEDGLAKPKTVFAIP